MATAAKQQSTGVRGSSVSTSSTKINSSTKTITNSTSGKTGGRSPSPSKQKPTFIETEEDIATIAKQISDHAEAIYQTWKARGLAPTEILNCHTGNSDAFGKALTPPNRNSLESPVAEILAQAPDMSNNNLEKLVNSFVNEDKARQQAAKKSSGNILTSGTIKDALRKFESNSTPCGYVKPNYLIKNASTSKSSYSKSTSALNNISNSNTNNGTGQVSSTRTTTATTTKASSSSAAAAPTPIPSSTPLSKSVPDVLIDTINQTKQQLPKNSVARSLNLQQTPLLPSVEVSSPIAATVSLVSSSRGANNSISNSGSTVSTNFKKPQTPAKPANLLNHTPSWPLKNRLGIGVVGNNLNAGGSSSSSSSNSNSSSGNSSSIGGSSTIKNDLKSRDVSSSAAIKKTIETGKKSADLLDEVSREEERLINALKTGVVLNNNDKLPEVITSTLNDKTDRASSWTKPDVSTTPSILTASTVAAKSVSIVIPQVVNKISTNTTSLLSSSPVAKITRTWSDDPVKAVISTSTSSSSSNNNNSNSTQSIVPPVMTSNSAAGVLTTVVHPNLQKATEIMSPAPAPSKIRLRPKSDAAVPHPETKNIRPFLSRGSVAERVLMFEKCPDVKVPLRNVNREPPKITTKPLVKPEQQTHTTLQRHIRSSSKNVYIPRFHFPHGKPLPTIAMETTLQRLVSAFDSFPNNQVTKEDLPHILKICGLPFYWRMPISACTQHSTSGLVDGYRFIEFWKQMSVYCHDEASRFVYILSRGQRSRPYILHEDLAPLVQDVVDTHPGLAFLKEATEFHSRYVHTVIARIFYTVNRSWSGKMTVPELRRSNLLQVIQLLEEEEDINQIMAFFSYEHFYVIYCKFWELDRDHDLFIDQNDLARHNDHALSTRIIERIFSGCVTRGGRTRISGPNGPKMSYTEFVWFLLSEEDKTNPTAIEYWFRCMDLDGDGILSMYELEYFYEEQQQRMEAIGIETLPFEDCLCQMLDMVKPVKTGCVTLGDLKRCRMTPIFFDTFFNLEKYLEHEQRDPFATQRESDDGLSDWDRYAAQEYELLVAEEGGDTQGSYDEDDEYESNIDILESQLDDMSNMINEW